MGVYIKGKRKPDTCYDCDFVDGSDDCFFGLGYTGDMCDCVYKDCPLIEIKTPHERLIDEAEVRVVMHQVCARSIRTYEATECAIRNMKAVIEAEDE